MPPTATVAASWTDVEEGPLAGATTMGSGAGTDAVGLGDREGLVDGVFVAADDGVFVDVATTPGDSPSAVRGSWGAGP